MTIPATAAIYVVKPDGSGDFATIQDAIDAAVDGDIIELTDGTFHGVDNRDVNWGQSSITVRSQNGDPEACTIDCEGSESEPHRGFRCTYEEASSSLLQGITIENGYADRGGAILCYEAIQVDNCILSYNSAEDGGAIAAVLGSTELTLTDCIFSNNSATDDGGGMYCQEGSCNLETCTFSWNGAGDTGGALFLSGSGTELTCADCTFAVNSANNGGGICCDDASLILMNSIIAFSTLGEAVYCAFLCDLTLTCCDIYGNAGGDWVDCIAGQEGINGNISEDPLFCYPENGDFTIGTDSPCAPFSPPNATCDLIGAWPVVCETAVCCRLGDCNVFSQQRCLDKGGAWLEGSHTCDPGICDDPIQPYTLCDVSWDENVGDDYGVPRLLGDDVNPEGITGIALSPSSTDREIQIAQGGCCVTIKHLDDDPDVEIGYGVTAYGTVSMDHGMNQISRPDFSITVDPTVYDLPSIPTISTDDHASHGYNYEYESCLISLEDVQVTSGNWPQVGEDGVLTIDDGSGPTTLRIFKESGINVNTAPSSGPFTVVGISGQYDEDGPPYDSGYDLRPRICEDIQPNNCPPLPAQPDVSATEEPRHFKSLGLSPCFPNPSRGLTRIRYAIPSGSEEVGIRVYDPAGHLLKTLVQETKTAGVYDVAWDGRNDGGASVAGGVYFFELTWNGRTETRQAIVLR